MYNGDAIRQTTVHYDDIDTAVHHQLRPDRSKLAQTFVRKGVIMCCEDYFGALYAKRFEGSKFAECE